MRKGLVFAGLLVALVALAAPASALTVTISGPETVWVPWGQCVWATWSTTSSYDTYDWAYDSQLVSTASSYSERFCSPELDYATNENHTIEVWVTDSGFGAHDALSFNVIFQAGTIEDGPCGFQVICE